MYYIDRIDRYKIRVKKTNAYRQNDPKNRSTHLAGIIIHPRHPRRLSVAPFPEQSPYTIFEHVTRSCPDESHFRQQQLSDHTTYLFSPSGTVRRLYAGRVGAPTFSRRFTAGNELHGALVLLQRPVKKSILFLRTTVVTVDIPCPRVTGGAMLVILIFKLPPVFTYACTYAARLSMSRLIRVETAVHGD